MKIIISGYGRMGHMVEASLKRHGLELVCASEDICAVPADVARECVCIDFTTPDAFKANYRTLATRFKAVVVGTTGWYDIKEEVFSAFEAAGTPLIWASNFSLGVNAFFAAVQRACEVLKGRGYTPEVEEIHHIHKLDAPSGTAKSIGVIIENTLGETPKIGSQRIGEVPGIHTATFTSDVDKLTFTHEAFSREGLAEGAVVAALMTEGLTGVHEFKDLIL
ncbi:MAG: 4-hydroxy-tetrahydrodipicolinate reductase [Bacteroidales bacterium]|nr:4-hydroxy-tetrahydrodipicolinate reductase [Bacteroidales bacterium]